MDVRKLGRWVDSTDRRALNWLARRHWVVLDGALPRLGRCADYGRLWLGLAGGLAVTRNRQARRAGLRGLIALSIASAVTNLVSKQLTGRARPATDTIPMARRLLRGPITSSFPSGHSASAAAFATAVAIEAPALAAPVGILAGAVAASRVVTGAHYPSDVVVGLASGTGAALLTLVWWPTVPNTPSAADHTSAPASPTGAGVVIVVNGHAHHDVIATIRRHLPAADIVRAGHDLAETMRSAAQRATVLGVAGGDGTVKLAARHALARDLPLLVLPPGRFAADLGVASAADAIAALRVGSAVRVDVGRAGDEVFLNTFSTGGYPDLVRFRQRWERRVGKWPATAVGLVQVLRRGEPQDIEVDGRARRVWLVFAGNGRYRPTGFAPTYRPSLADDHLDLRVVTADARWARTRIVLGTLTRTLRWSPVYRATTPSHVRLGAHGESVRMSTDGEVTIMPETLDVRVDPRALVVYRPAART